MDKRLEIIRGIMQAPGTGFIDSWGHTADVSFWGTFQRYLARMDSTVHLLDYLWPVFLEVDGLVFRQMYAHPQTVEQWRAYCQQQGNLKPEQLEFLVNHLHLFDVFQTAPDRAAMNEEVWWYLGETIAEMWRCRLMQLFPDRRFDVEVYEGYGIEVSAITVRDEPI